PVPFYDPILSHQQLWRYPHMGQRAESLAKQFEQANADFTESVEQCSDAEWKAKCEDLGWSFGVTAHHVAQSTTAIAGLAQTVASGQSIPPFTMDQLNEGNAQRAQQFANCTKQDVLDLLRTRGPTAASMFRGLSDE